MGPSLPRRLLLALGLPLLAAASHAAQPAAGRTKEEAALLAAPAAELIPEASLAPAVRQAVSNGLATLVARITAPGNDHGLTFPPTQTVKVREYVEVPAKRVSVTRPVFDWLEVEVIEPVMESGQATGRFQRVKRWTRGKQTGTRTTESLTPDPDGSETMKIPKYGPGGPAAWTANLPGLNGMALFILAKAGLGKHPATLAHAEALAAHVKGVNGLPDNTFDVAWMAAGFTQLGDPKHDKLVRRLLDKLVDGQVREKGRLDGLWGPVCVNYGYYGKLFMLGQTVRQELDVQLPKKLQQANPAQAEQLVALGKEMQALSIAYAQTNRDVFRCGAQMLGIRSAHVQDEELLLPGLPLEAVRRVARPNGPRDELAAAILATRWPRQETPPPAAPAAAPAGADDQTAPDKAGAAEAEPDDSLGTFEDLLKPPGEG